MRKYLALLLLGTVLVLLIVLSSDKYKRWAFERFCSKRIDMPLYQQRQTKPIVASATKWDGRSYQPRMVNLGLNQKIPQRIIQTNERDDVPVEMANATESIISNNPEYDYWYFNDQQAKQYLQTNFPEVYECYLLVRPGAYKADLFRYCVLYKDGGVYVDCGMRAVGKLRDSIHPNDMFVSAEDDGTGGVYNAFIACAPGHPIIAKAIEMCVKNIRSKNYTNNPLAITGPLLLTRAFTDTVDKPAGPDTDYGNGVRLFRYERKEVCTTGGLISDRGYPVLYTRYDGYHMDRAWYNTTGHYSDIWKNKMVYPNPPTLRMKEHQDHLKGLFAELLDILHSHGLEYSIEGGTLLGAVREGDIIDHDDDIDILAPEKTVAALIKMLPELKKKGYNLTYDDDVWRFKYLVKSDRKVEAYIDIFETIVDGDRIRYKHPRNAYRWPNSYMYLNELYPLKRYTFGSLKPFGPNIPDLYLERQYGDWKTPVKWDGHHEL